MSNTLILAVITLMLVLLTIAATTREKVSSLSAENPISTPTSTPAPSPTVAAQTENKISPEPTKESEKPQTTQFDNLKYPGATVTRFDGDTMFLESSDDPETVTNWYKQRLSSLKMNINNFVRTKANESVLNVLSAIDSKYEVKAEIRRENLKSRVRILVSINNFSNQ